MDIGAFQEMNEKIPELVNMRIRSGMIDKKKVPSFFPLTIEDQRRKTRVFCCAKNAFFYVQLYVFDQRWAFQVRSYRRKLFCFLN